MKKTILTITFLIGIINLNYANNIQIKNLRLTGQNTVQDFYLVEFDISWENSWRTSTLESNWDAAWVFVKFSIVNAQDFNHASIHYVNGTAVADGHTEPAGSTITTPSDGKGIFIHRDADGIGNVNWQNVQLRWDYGVDGIQDNDILEIRVFGIEMVYVPQGQFYLGDGENANAQFEWGLTGNPYLVTSENQITLGGGGANSLGNNNGGNGDDFSDAISRTLPAAFPKGFQAFYCMKYEVSKQQYADFLATLTNAQRLTNLVVGMGFSGDFYANPVHPYRSVGEVDWIKVATYLDWTALRPMSELEYEKACRGTQNALSGEYAWGNTSRYQGNFNNNIYEGTDSAIVDSKNLAVNSGNYQPQSALSGIGTPQRVGIFAASVVNKTRVETGSSYWGVMELTGNVSELVISVGNSQSRDFSGLHGDGAITNSGNASLAVLTDWAFANASGVGLKSSWSVSDRRDANANDSNTDTWYGIRGVRSAP